MKIAIIGGGASGIVAAITAAAKGNHVVLFERLERVGKKILATGNGRCNLMCLCPNRYPTGDSFVKKAYSVYSPQALWHFFESLGLALREESMGRVYPASGQAATVLNVLLAALNHPRIALRLSTPVQAITAQNGTYQIQGESFERVIISGGGKAQSKLGSDGSCYTLLRSLGHDIVPPTPALTAFSTDTTAIRGLKGVRIKATVTLKKGHTLIRSETGELLFTDYGVSGICIMQLSSYFQKEMRLHIDLRPAINLEEEAFHYLCSRRDALPFLNAETFLTGLFVTPLGTMLKQHVGLTSLDDDTLGRLANAITDFSLPIESLRGFEHAQVTNGGATLDAFDPFTMSSRLRPGLYATGEVLNVTGDCGGYNLMFAFISGIIAGMQ